MDTTPEQPDEPADDTAAPPRWFARWLPVTLVVLVVLALIAVAVPGVRRQLSLSTSRHDERFAALAFPISASGDAAACRRTGRVIRVPFEVESHLGRRQGVDYAVGVLVRPKKGASVFRKQTGSVTVADGRTEAVSVAFRRMPRGPFAITVILPGRDVRLHARCDGSSA